MFSLAGKTALITGAARGIGLAIARAFAGQGADVILADCGAGPLEEATREVRRISSGAVRQFVCDISSQASLDALREDMEAANGSLDILVNNAGVFSQLSLEETPAETLEYLLAVNVVGMFRASVTLLPFLKSNGGAVINLSSYLAEIARPMTGVYATTKGAVRQLTKSMAVEWARYGIRVNAIAPGSMLTEMTAGNQQKQDWMSVIKRRVPLGTMGTAEDAANCAVFLASDEAGYITGATIVVDGGILASL